MSASEPRPLSSMRPGESGVVSRVLPDTNGRAERLAALGVTPGARIRVLQTFPGIVFECDETELAVERTVARVILVCQHPPARRDKPEAGRSHPRPSGPRRPRTRGLAFRWGRWRASCLID